MNVEDCNATSYANVNHALDGELHEAEESHFGPGDMDDMLPMTENITVLNCNNSSNISMQVGQFARGRQSKRMGARVQNFLCRSSLIIFHI